MCFNRYNLDPLDAFTDEDIWTALEKAHVKGKVIRYLFIPRRGNPNNR